MFRVRGQNQGLHPSSFALDAHSREMGKDKSLKGGKGGFEGCKSAGGQRGRGLRGDPSMVLRDSEFGDLTLAAAVVEDEKRQAGVAEQAPGFS